METILRASYLEQLKNFRDKQVIKVITGIRRCGKSTLLNQFQQHLIQEGVRQDQMIAINFEDIDNEPLCEYHAFYQYIKERLHPAEMTYIFCKELALEYIALHGAKVAAVEEVKHDMGDYAGSEAIYNLIGGPAIEAAHNANQITEAKNAAIAKLEEYSVVLGDAHDTGFDKGKAEALGAMGEPCTDCPAVDVTKGTTTIRLYSPEKVEFRKME